ncbi:MAG: F0F1 ATP synthase subunit epsilon [Ignavibacteria bacterium]|jgi:F-type H+-transporting ATPase subunit epsilon|nr:F0F1 ATP synthase subunit epsilon [Ignavibacteria bacterium]MCU7501498.1 F0F1 ATP synthase subunit epsilon [Ignavibacteria bacterium]MCU7515986.1 F0F1 ATP synthase subunit epsilon [Ignavibacteria bacterium]
MKELFLEVVTPSKVAYAGNIKSVTIPGTMGSFQVLYNHAPLISSIEIGPVKIVEENGSVRFFAISGGTVEVKDNKILVLAESIEEAPEIDVERAKKAVERAKERLKEGSLNFDVDRAQASLSRAMNRISISTKYRPVSY